MSSPEPVVHSFIVRVWVEEGVEIEGSERRQIAAWHGQATNVPGGETYYFRDFGALIDFMISKLGFENRWRRDRLRQRLKRWLKPF
jgi:hypothetical protein